MELLRLVTHGSLTWEPWKAIGALAEPRATHGSAAGVPPHAGCAWEAEKPEMQAAWSSKLRCMDYLWM